LIFAFLGGLLLDLSGGTTLGLSSLGYLLCLAIILIYSRRFQVKNIFFWLVLFFLSSLIFDLVHAKGWRLQDGLLLAALSLPIFLLLNKWGILGEGEEEIKLKI